MCGNAVLHSHKERTPNFLKDIKYSSVFTEQLSLHDIAGVLPLEKQPNKAKNSLYSEELLVHGRGVAYPSGHYCDMKGKRRAYVWGCVGGWMGVGVCLQY